MKAANLMCLIALLALPLIASAQDAEVKPVKPALLVIDIQNKYIPMMAEEGQETAFQLINGAIWKFRNYGLPILRVYHTTAQYGPDPESEDFQFPESVIIQESDPQIIKNYPSAFVETELEAMLKEMDVNTLFLCGLSATGCVLATYYGAMERHYDVFMIEGAVMSHDAEQTEDITEIVSSIGWSGLDVVLRAVASK